MKRPYLEAGALFNRLTALETAMGSQDMILWRCTCGNEKRVRATQVVCGVTKSCDCLRRERVSASLKARRPQQWRNYSKHALYNVWHGMMARTANPAHKDYSCYGGRGIAVCERWRHPETFYADIERLIGPRPSRRFTLDRIDNDGNYEPGNVRWATAAEQANNQRRRRKVSEQVRIQALEAEVAQLREQIRALEERLTYTG